MEAMNYKICFLPIHGEPRSGGRKSIEANYRKISADIFTFHGISHYLLFIISKFAIALPRIYEALNFTMIFQLTLLFYLSGKGGGSKLAPLLIPPVHRIISYAYLVNIYSGSF